MSELEEKLGAILSNQGAMEQIMSLARSLGGGGGEEAQPPPSPVPPPAEPPAPAGLLEGLDPRLLRVAMGLMGEYRAGGGEREALLQALRPFVKEGRGRTIDRAIQAARVSHALRAAWELLREPREEEDHV